MWSLYRSLQREVEAATQADADGKPGGAEGEHVSAVFRQQILNLEAQLQDAAAEFTYISDPWNPKAAPMPVWEGKLVYAKARQAADRKAVQNAHRQAENRAGLKLYEGKPDVWLTPSDIDVAIKLSDILGLNEITCASLVMDSQQHKTSVLQETSALFRALYLYHDAVDALLSCFNILLVARKGRTYGQTFSPEFHRVANRFIDTLGNFTTTLLSMTMAADVEAEMKRLKTENLFGDDGHMQLMRTVIEGQHEALADCVFNMCVQCCVSPTRARAVAGTAVGPKVPSIAKLDMIAMVAILRRKAPSDPSQALDSLTVSLTVSLLYLLDFGVNLERFEVQSHNFSTDPEITKQLEETWDNPVLQRLISFAVGLSSGNEDTSNLALTGGAMDLASTGIFRFLRTAVLSTKQFSEKHSFYPFFMDVLHFMLIKFLEDWATVNLIKNTGEEQARDEVPRNDFRDLMQLIAELYGRDHAPDSSDLHWRQLVGFVHLCGDQVHPELYVAYLDMLAGLAGPGPGGGGARCVFDLLTDNGRPGRRQSIVSWNVLFAALHKYGEEFHRQSSAMDPSLAMDAGGPRRMDPSHVGMLEAFLRVMQRVVENDAESRLKLFENRDYAALANLFALVSASIPARLKAALFKAVEAFCLSPDAAAMAWWCFDQYQLLKASPNGRLLHDVGIKYELEERESFNKTYPQTTAFLSLLHKLVPHIPATLGTAWQQQMPGFVPYLTFLRESVLLKFDTRAYSDPGERWLVAAGALEVMHSVLDAYHPQESDFVLAPREQQGPGLQGAALAGFELVKALLGESSAKTLWCIFQILEKGVDRDKGRRVQKPLSPEHAQAMTDSILLSLQIVEQLFRKQDLFVVHGLLTTRVEDLLLDVDITQHRTVRVLHVAHYVSHACDSELALQSVKILWWLSRSVAAQPKLASIFRSHIEPDRSITLHAFEQRLGDVRPEASGHEPACTDVLDQGHAHICNAISFSILHIILYNLSRNTPNLAHLLLGFPLIATTARDISQASLLARDASGSTRSCLHAILELVGQGIGAAPDSASRLADTNPLLAELCYKVIYQLCWDRHTSAPVMRYLRDETNFFLRHLEDMQPLSLLTLGLDGAANTSLQRSARLKQQAWLMKTIALELYVTASTRERAHTRLLDLLFRRSGAAVESMTTDDSSQAPRMRILRLLDPVTVTAAGRAVPHITFFEPQRVNDLFKLYTRPLESKDGVDWCDLGALHHALLMELDSSMQLGGSQRQDAIQEATQLLSAAMDLNLANESEAAKLQFFKAWQQVVEVALIKYPYLLRGTERTEVISELLTELLAKVSAENTLPSLVSAVSGISVSLMANLRQTLLLERQDVSREHHQLLLAKGTLRQILAGIMDGILRSDMTRRTRQNHYAALLFYLQIANEDESEEWVHRSGDRFMDAVCHDASDGESTGAILALSALNAMMALDTQQRWLQFLQRHGYLVHYVDEICRSDAELCTLLNPHASTFRSLYVHKARLALLNRIALCEGGVPALLQAEVMFRLARCRFHSCRPYEEEMEILPTDVDSYVSPPLERYREMSFPILKLAVSLLESSKLHHVQAVTQVLHFVAAHVDKQFRVVLKDRTRQHTPLSLEELSLVTTMLRLLAGRQNEALARSVLEHHHARLQLLMIHLLAKTSSESWMARTDLGAYSKAEQNEMEFHALNVVANVVSYARILMSSPHEALDPQAVSRHKTLGLYRILLRPSMVRSAQDNTGTASNFPPLGIVLRHMDMAARRYKVESRACEKRKNDLAKVNDLTNEELRELDPALDSLPQADRHKRAKPKLVALVEHHRKMSSLCWLVIENLLTVLWCHLEWYLKQCEPAVTTSMGASSLRSPNDGNPRILRAGLNGHGITASSGDGEIRLSQSAQDLNDLRFQEFSAADMKAFRAEVLTEKDLKVDGVDSVLQRVALEEKTKLESTGAGDAALLQCTFVQPLRNQIRALLRSLDGARL